MPRHKNHSNSRVKTRNNSRAAYFSQSNEPPYQFICSRLSRCDVYSEVGAIKLKNDESWKLGMRFACWGFRWDMEKTCSWVCELWCFSKRDTHVSWKFFLLRTPFRDVWYMYNLVWIYQIKPNNFSIDNFFVVLTLYPFQNHIIQ